MKLQNYIYILFISIAILTFGNCSFSPEALRSQCIGSAVGTVGIIIAVYFGLKVGFKEGRGHGVKLAEHLNIKPHEAKKSEHKYGQSVKCSKCGHMNSQAILDMSGHCEKCGASLSSD